MFSDDRRVPQRSSGTSNLTQPSAWPHPASPAAPAQQPGDASTGSQSSGQPQVSGQSRTNPLAPSLSLPKAGGAIAGLGEKFAANPLTGVPSLTVPIATSPGRSGFGPQLSLRYQPGAGNGPFGLEWALGVPAVSRKTEKGLPRFDDAAGSDTFLLSDAEDLVPALVLDPSTGGWNPDTTTLGPYIVQRYRPRVEGLFARIERLQHASTGAVFWRAVTRDNVTSIYGQSLECRIADPTDATRVFTWLLEATYDDKGNLCVYEYKAENLANVDPDAACEAQRRTGTAPIANRYVKFIRYGNVNAYTPDATLVTPASQFGPDDPDWLFHVVFDYGEHDAANPALDDVTPDSCQNLAPKPQPFTFVQEWTEAAANVLCARMLPT